MSAEQFVEWLHPLPEVTKLMSDRLLLLNTFFKNVLYGAGARKGPEKVNQIRILEHNEYFLV